MIIGTDGKKRCFGGQKGKEFYAEYHDNEWGVPSHDDRHLFEMLILEGAQAGLSWSTILNRREGYRKAYGGFDPQKVARFSAKKQAELLDDERIIRNRAKIAASVLNAAAFLRIQKEFGSFDAYVWAFVNGKPIQNAWEALNQVPSETEISRVLSKDLSKRGFKFVGSTIVYAFMQSVGLVNDHLVDCPRWKVCKTLK